MKTVHAPLVLPDADATTALAQSISPLLQAGDVLLLEGEIGAGKTHFARALIQSFVSEDVPSPTFTLVQTYLAPDFEIWHADLYRLSHPDEAIELGLTEAFESAVCLVEWPDKLGDDQPKAALTLQFLPSGEGREVRFSSDGQGWADRLKGITHV